jgi:peroxin-1
MPLDPQQQQKIKDQEAGEAGRIATKLVAKVEPWDDAPDANHGLLSSNLCAALGKSNMVGGVIRVEAAPAPVSRGGIKTLKVFPFMSPRSRQADGFQFGGETKASRQAAAEMIRDIYGSKGEGGIDILNGPLTDGMALSKPISRNEVSSWYGGLLRFDPPASSTDTEGSQTRWIHGQESINLEVQQEIPNPYDLRKSDIVEEGYLPAEASNLAGIDEFVANLVSVLSRQSSVLLNGGLGSGKTSAAQAAANRLRREGLYHVIYFNCRKLVTNETRISTIKETLTRVFMAASWGARLGGNSLIILDDLDRLCPAETELQVGGENGRSRQLSELICSIVRQYCGADSGVVLLATAQGKDAMSSVIIGGHVVRETLDLKAPDKEKRRQILKSLTSDGENIKLDTNGGSASPAGSAGDWMDGSLPNSRPTSSANGKRFGANKDLDFLDIAGQTDGYMPGDLALLVSRARSEALIRTVSDPKSSSANQLCKDDFQQALTGFTPASLRNVTLQSSSTTFDSIGGLHETRKILLETLQYPTTYAPIFAQCPLRLRSGLLLYGYPGCGKTLLASAVAGECGLNFISVKGPEILNKYIGASEKSVRDLFDRAEAARPCVLFFDEFDSIAPKRGHDSTGVTDRVVNQLLTQMDGAEGLSGVYVLAATSRPDLIDPALLRPGRLDKSLLCDMPSLDDRLDILRALSKKLKVSEDVKGKVESGKNLMEIACRTEGYSGADLQAVVYNAQLEAIHDVLGDNKGAHQNMHGTKHKPKAQASASVITQDLIQFRFGEEEDRKEAAERVSSGFNRSRQIAERAGLAAKLEAIKQAKRKERALRRGGDADSRNGNQGTVSEEEEPEVTIQWKHIEASLATTRSSISAVERQKLETIYREFVVGRNGEMPNGQAPMEVGGRSSLM